VGQLDLVAFVYGLVAAGSAFALRVCLATLTLVPVGVLISHLL
jgi:hypothetical protein